jgi:hypothetical protein
VRCKCLLMTQSGHRQHLGPKLQHLGPRLLTGPFQMMWLETNRDILATLGDAGRGYEGSEKPTPCLHKFNPIIFPQ